MRAMESLLVVFVPGRSRLGALEASFRKLRLQFVEGCGEPPVREVYAGRPGLLLTLVGWTPEAESKGRLTLPRVARDALAAVAGALPGGAPELIVLSPGGALRGEAEVDEAGLAAPLRVGCRYRLVGPPPAPTIPPPGIRFED
jgi:hypothetical protein